MSSTNPENESMLSPEPSHPPGLPATPSREAIAHQSSPPTPNDGFLTVDIPSATSSSASSPVVINHADAAPPIVLKDGCDPPHVVPIDDMDPAMLQDLVRDPKGKFVTTTSPEAAKELRKRFNQAHQKREPEQLTFYVLTNFVNQYGKPAYRVEPRGQVAPAASGAAIAERITLAATSTGSTPHSPPPRTKTVKNYRSILNIRSSNNVAGRHTTSSSIAESSGSRSGQASGSTIHPHHGTGERNRLRKSRSNSDFGGVPSPGASGSSRHGTRPETPSRRQHSHTVSGADMAPQPIPRIDTPAMGPHPANFPAAMRPSGSNIPLDLLGVVMQDGSRGSTSPSLMSPSGSIAPSLDASLASYVTSQEGGSSGKGTSANPFGPGVAFDCPQGSTDVSEPSSPSHLTRFTDGENTPNGLISRRMNATLRVMQSFESGMTARAGDHLRHQKSFSGLGMTLDSQSEEGTDSNALGLDNGTPDDEPKEPVRPIVPGALFISGDLDLELQANNTEAVRTSISSLQQLAAPGSLFLASTDLIDQSAATATAAESPLQDDAASISTSNSSNTHTLPAPGTSTTRHRLNPATAAYTGIWNVDTFDVIQTSRGLPIIGDEIMLHDRDKVLQLSIESENSALPKNDPRFVIWGDLHPLKTLGSHASGTSVHGPGPARILANSDSTGRLRSNSASTQVSSAPSQTSSGGDISSGKVIVAASIERWIAQLTAEMRSDELLVFFLTYRIYLDGVTLAQLLITRFHWTLDQSSTPHDEDIRKIVRVRTFVAFKFWIQKFFTVDFAESVVLRRTISGWLNTLKRDPIIQYYPGLHSMVNKLISTIKVARDEFERDHPNRARRSTNRSNKPKEHPDVESDLEADFLGESTGDRDEAPAFQSLVFKDGPNDRTVVLAVPSIAAGAHLPPGVTVVPSASALTATFATTTPVPTNALTRALTNTFGRMGRWRRALSTRSDAQPVIAPAAKVSAFDIDLTWDNAEFHGRPMAEHGGTSHLPRPTLHPVAVAFSPPFAPAEPSPAVSVPPKATTGLTADVEDAASAPILQPVAEIGEDGSNDGHQPPDETLSVTQIPAEETASQTVAVDSEDAQSISTHEPVSSTQISPKSSIVSHITQAGQTSQSETLQHPSFEDAPSYRSSFASSRFSYQSGASDEEYQAPPGLQPIKTVDIGGGNWRSRFAADAYNNEFDDFSDSDDEPSGAAVRGKLQQTKRRMPRRGDFELVRHRESASSYGAPSRSSVISSGSDQGHPGQMPLGILHQWQLNALVDEISDDEEAGDRETALLKLQGQIRDNPEQARQRDVHLEGWLQNIRDRQAAGDWQDEQPRFPTDGDNSDEEEDYGQPQAEEAIADNELLVPPPDNDGEAVTPLAEVPPPLTIQPPLAEEGRPPVEEAVPLEILQSRVTPEELPQSKRNSQETASSSAMHLPAAPRASFVTKLTYRKSFVLELPSLVVAQHFAMIDRELFLAIKFEELTDTDSLPQTAEANFLDWTQFLKDRARARAERRFGNITMSLVAVRARFNLLAGFVVSEILLAHPNDRPAVHSKFLRIAWKSQQINSFGTLVAIMIGLDSEWVRRAMKQHYGRLVSSDRTIFTVLKRWVTSEGDFTFIKGEVNKLQEVKMGRPHASSIASAHSDNVKRPSEPFTSQGAIPFIGIYLSQMRQIGEMPNLVDPTAPREVIDWNTDPRHPEVFAALAPLPPSTPLKALINVQKQRRIAAVIQSLVAGQHLAARVQYAVDRKVYQRCLKIRALSYDELQNAVDAQGL